MVLVEAKDTKLHAYETAPLEKKLSSGDWLLQKETSIDARLNDTI